MRNKEQLYFEKRNAFTFPTSVSFFSAGGVGIAVTQLCQTLPDVTVFGTASASKHETIAQGGVTHPIDYRTKDYVEEIRKISPKGSKTHTCLLWGSSTRNAEIHSFLAVGKIVL